MQTLSSSHLTWNRFASDDLPKNVVGDSARVMQVFTNLIGNSIKFTSKGRIMVRGRLGDPEPNGLEKLRRRSFSNYSLETFAEALPASDEVVIVFEVDDTGPGIEPGPPLSCFTLLSI